MKVRQRVTADGMTQAEALAAIRAAEDRNFITVSDAALASGLSAVSIRCQAREDAKTGSMELGYSATIAGSRVNINRASFLQIIDKGR